MATRIINGVLQVLSEGVWRGEGEWLQVDAKTYNAHKVGDVFNGKVITEKPYLGKANDREVVVHFRLK